MILIIIYLFIDLMALISIFVLFQLQLMPNWIINIKLLVYCMLLGGLGGFIYCSRAIYVNYCVNKKWDPYWNIWYYIRPIVSCVSGAVSWLFLKSGLLILDSTQKIDSSNLGFYALAFIAGYNVDKFMNKIEQISEATWGIEKSRSSKLSNNSIRK